MRKEEGEKTSRISGSRDGTETETRRMMITRHLINLDLNL